MLAEARRLLRSEYREADAAGGEDLEAFQVDRGLGEPHPLRLPTEAMLEVADAPEHLRPFVPGVGQGQDRVVVDLGDRRAVSRESSSTRVVGLDHGAVGRRVAVLQPAQQGRPEVEADPLVVADATGDASAVVEDRRGRVGRVALGRDPLVPVVVRVGRFLPLDLPRPGIVARRLVEVAVDAEVAGQPLTPVSGTGCRAEAG